MTFGDRVEYFMQKYIRRTKKDDVKGVEDELLLPSQYGNDKPFKELSPKQCYDYALMSALFMKGVVKKNSDTFRAWFKLKREDGIKMPEEEVSIIKSFEKRSEVRKKFKIGGMCADVWGDGYLLIKFYEPYNIGKNKLKKPVKEDAEPLDLILLNPEYITERYYVDNDKQTLYYHYVNRNKNEDFPIHPDRILHIKTIEFPNSAFGVSKAQILRNILISSADIDVATGEILKWFSHGIQILTKQNMSKQERDKALKLLQEHPNYFAFSEKYSFDIKNPVAINPMPFYDHVTEAIAAVLCMPKQVLLGVQIGRVTGAEIGYADYYRDIRDNQDLVYTPLIEKLYNYLGKAYNRDFSKYDVVWNIIYIDELAEAELLGKRVAAAVNARSTVKPIISIGEARRIISEGQIELDPEDIPNEENLKQSKLPINDKPEPKPEPSDRVVLPVKRETEDDNWKKEMIENYKELMNIVKKERKLGEEVLEEQDKLFGKKEDKDGSN